MCLIIHSPTGHSPSEDIIESALSINPDGVGFMYMDRGKPESFKILHARSDYIERVCETLKDTEYCVHFRMRTHGDVSADNLHPFDLANGGLLMHNGVMHNIDTKSDTKKSDTWHLVHGQINPAIRQNQPEQDWWNHIADIAGYHNRLAYLSPTGQFHFLNYEDGVEYEGAWYSNTYAWRNPSERDYYRNDTFYFDDLHCTVVEELAKDIRAGRLLPDKFIGRSLSQIEGELWDLEESSLIRLVRHRFAQARATTAKSTKKDTPVKRKRA